MYIVEGNIGVGKTTFLSLLKKEFPDMEFISEPVQSWDKQAYGQSLLANFYQSTPRWAYTLETFTMFCRTRNHMILQKDFKQERIFERSIYSGHYCFAKNSFASGYMTKVEWKVYNEWANFLIHQRCTPPTGFIYLKASPQVCFERITHRNRSSEKSLTLEYLKQINYWHNEFLIEKSGLPPSLKKVPVLVLDCNKDFLKNTDNMKKHSKKLQQFFSQAPESFNLSQDPYTLTR